MTDLHQPVNLADRRPQPTVLWSARDRVVYTDAPCWPLDCATADTVPLAPQGDRRDAS